MKGQQWRSLEDKLTSTHNTRQIFRTISSFSLKFVLFLCFDQQFPISSSFSFNFWLFCWKNVETPLIFCLLCERGLWGEACLGGTPGRLPIISCSDDSIVRTALFHTEQLSTQHSLPKHTSPCCSLKHNWVCFLPNQCPPLETELIVPGKFVTVRVWNDSRKMDKFASICSPQVNLSCWPGVWVLEI